MSAVVAEDHGRGQAMLVSGEEARGARLAKKAETRGMIHISPLLPAGTDALEGLQSRRAFPPDEAGMEQWRMSVDSATDDFAFANRGQTTLIEHEDYMMKINRYPGMDNPKSRLIHNLI